MFQNGHQKWQEIDFWEKSPVDSADNLQVKNFVEIALSHSISEINRVFAFYAEIQDGRQKWWKNNFCGKNASRLCRYPADQNFR